VTLSISALPRVAACPGSAALPQASTTSADAERGTDNHSAAERAIIEGQLDKLPAEVRELIPRGALVVAEAIVYYDWQTDTARVPADGAHGKRAYTPGPTEIPGTIDLLVIHGDRVTVLDYKMHSDVGNPDENEQLLGYALAAARVCKAADVTLVVAYIDADEDGTVKLLRPLVARQLDELDLDAYAAKLRGIIAAVEAQRARRVPDVRENKHCRYCPAAVHCPAKTALIRRLVSGQERDELELAMPLTPETAAEAYKRLGHARALLKRIESAIYAFASQQDIPLGNGQVLGKRVKLGNEQIDGNIAWEVLREQYDDDVANAAVTREASKAGIERALKASGVKPLAPAMRSALAAIGERGGAKRELKETIDEHPAQLPEEASGAGPSIPPDSPSARTVPDTGPLSARAAPSCRL
jgi:hypothetical protein